MDLTEALKGAPHSAEVLKNVTYVGKIAEAQEMVRGLTFAQKTFIKMAYVNLIIIFLILACISVWRWGFP
jgi:hypothetical protein